MKTIRLLVATCLPFVVAAMDYRPETWFHVIGGNASKAGLTADLEALKGAGFGGIQFFHGQYGKASEWDGVAEQIPCLSAKWDDLVRHAADECARLGLTFKMQNCPGWSMSGGPWIAPSNAMRKLVYARKDIQTGGSHTSSDRLRGSLRSGDISSATDKDAQERVPPIPIPPKFRDIDSDWHDVCYLAFPTPEGDDVDESGMPISVSAAKMEGKGNVRVFRFEKPVTIRTLELPSPSQLNHAWCYNPDTRVIFEAETDKGWRTACDIQYPQGCWQDQVPFSIACYAFASKTWRLTLSAPHEINLRYVRLRTAVRFDNWEGQAGWVLRGQMKRPYPKQDAAAYIPYGAVRVVKPGDTLCDARGWTILRIGHVNMKKVNAPAPKEATGWECDKLDPSGIDANFAGYIGRLVDGPLAGGKLKGMIVDSWECERQTWTWRMEEWFREANGYDVKTIIPAIFGWVIGSPADTEKLLLDWRRTVAGLVTKNYYGHMAELAHAKGLSVAYETALGDVVPGDILEYWKYCDTPMCEFWQPYTPEKGSVGHPNFKPVRPCVSAAHLYGKRRVDCESFTNTRLTWDENLRGLKEQAVRHFARGVTHFVFHTYTHQPQIDGRVPGTSFGSFIGTPFIRGQTWWSFMRPFTDWTVRCCEFLERGYPVVDALRYLGDDLDHKPDELEYFPEGFKNDYLNEDVLFNRLDVKDGRFVLPDGMSYSVLWVPDSVMVLPKTKARLDALAAKGGRIVYGSADDAVKRLEPQIAAVAGRRALPSDGRAGSPLPADILWYHRIDGEMDCFFVAAAEKGFSGEVSFNTQHGMKRLSLSLAPFETQLLEFNVNGVRNVEMCKCENMKTANTQCGKPFSYFHNSTIPQFHNSTITNWSLSFPAGWGAPAKMSINRLVSWKDLPGVSDEGHAFSGTATYEANVECKMKNVKCGEANVKCGDGDSGKGKKKSVVLDLGDVRDFARVFVNGQEVAALWAQPYSCDITSFVKQGDNSLKVEVTSTWFNRLAYDFSQPPEKRKTWTIWDIGNRPPPCLMPGAQLRDSGLLGPVRIISNE